jgi:hypothetical protein
MWLRVGPSEHCNERSNSIKGVGFLDQLSALLAAQGLCRVELVKGSGGKVRFVSCLHVLTVAYSDCYFKILHGTLSLMHVNRLI